MSSKPTMAVLIVFLASAAVPAQTAPAVPFPKAPAPGLLPPSLASVPNAQPLPTAPAVLPPATTRLEPSLTAPENLMTFDPQRTELAHDGNHWQLVVDGIVLTDFGAHEHDARVALRLVRDLGLNQHATVGTPTPVMEYWLHDGKAPYGVTDGLKIYPLEQRSLRVEQHEGDWCLRDGQRLLFNFGASADDAQQALGILRKYGFTQVSVLGQAGPMMLIFLGRPASGATAGPMRSLGADPRVPSRTSAPTPVTTPPAPVVTTAALEPSPFAQRTAVDWRQAQVHKEGNVWKLTDGHEIAKFNSERDAQQALSTVLYYHFTEREQVGSPKPHFSYFLVDGQVPRGPVIGVHCELFQPDRLRVVQVGDRWTISNGERVLLSFDDQQEEARHVLDVIRQQKCDRLCRIGMTDEFGLTFLARSR
jgi:hypothetical protein